MPKLMGITSLSHHIPTKQDILLFDKIGVVRLEAGLSELRDPEIAAGLEYLVQNEVLFDAKYSPTKKPTENSAEQYLIEAGTISATVAMLAAEVSSDRTLLDRLTIQSEVCEFISRLMTAKVINIDRVADSVVRIFDDIKNQGVDLEASLGKLGPRMSEKLPETVVRLLCLELSKGQAVEATPMIQPSAERDTLLGPSAEGVVIEIVLQSLPLPGPDTPLEAIVEFRGDPELRRKFQALRLWMRKMTSRISTANGQLKEVEQELEQLVHEYEQHMRVHQLRVNKTLFETSAVFVAGLIEDTLKLRLESAAKRVFIQRSRKIQLLEAELSAPGKEVSFIVAARRRFDESKQ